jgi:phage protein D
MAEGTAAPPYEITIGGEIEKSDFLSFVVERDMFQPDMAAIVLSNQAGAYSSTKIGDPVEIKIGDDKTSIYKGEVVGLEATYKGGEKTRLLIRAMNKFHRLIRHCKSVTFTDKSDQQILSQVVGDAELSLKWKHEKNITYKHVYQHNQSDMEFLRTRAARLGCHVWCVGDEIHVKEPDLTAGPIATLKTSSNAAVAGDTNPEAPGGANPKATGATIKAFTPRLSSANIVKKVTVRGWNPETKELIIGDFSAQNSKLGKQNAVAASDKLGKEETFTVDHPIWSKEEAVALAKARLVELSLTYITGECEITGDPKMELGAVVEIEANTEPDTKADDPFNGRYYIMGVTHRLLLTKTKDGGYTTILRLARDAQKA